MPKITLGAILVAVAGSVLAASLLFHAPVDGDQRLQDRINSELEHNRGAVEMRELTDFKWDRFCVFAPYTSNDTVAQVIGFQWPMMKMLGAKDREGFNLLIFVRAGAVVSYVDEPRQVADFVGFKSSECFTPASGLVRFTSHRISAVRPLSNESHEVRRDE